MKLEILSPEQKVFEGEATVVTFPGAEGSFQVMDHHAPLVASLGNGLIVIKDNQGKELQFETDGGIVEVRNNKVAALVEKSGAKN